MKALFTLTALAFFGLGFLSMLTHAVKKWVAGEIQGNLIDWYVVNPKMTVGAIIACIGGVATAILTGTLTDYMAGAQVLAVWGIGFAADTVNSQGKR
jgi:hypothetical protein